jgi:hypothetical protein
MFLNSADILICTSKLFFITTDICKQYHLTPEENKTVAKLFTTRDSEDEYFEKMREP